MFYHVAAHATDLPINMTSIITETSSILAHYFD